MNILFRSHHDLTEIETLLMSKGYKAMSGVSFAYYTEFDNRTIERLIGGDEFLVLIVDMETKIYKVTFYNAINYRLERIPIYTYPEMKPSIHNILTVPSYKPRKILKS